MTRSSPDSRYGLLPCPFCGAPARTDLLPHAQGPGWVQCSECECGQHMSDTLEEAVIRWNTRSRSSAATEEPIARQLLREARQYVFAFGNDEDGETQNNSINLLSEIDALLSGALAQPSSEAREKEITRLATIEVCARELESSYPDHAWLNAACAAIRALK